jgi:hypothetical protein
MNLFKKLANLGVALGVFAMASAAYAVTPANSLLTNTAKLTYAGNATGITSAVSVTISLVPAIVSGTTTPPDISLAGNQSYLGSYVIVSNANGPDDYTITTALNSVGTVTATSAPLLTVINVNLGATAAIAPVTVGPGNNFITVPSDGLTDGNVNGISAVVGNNMVVINGTTYTVSSIVDNATGTSTITLSVDLVADVAIGDGVYESINVDSTIADIGAAGGGVNDVVVQVNVESDTNTALDFTDTTTITVVSVAFTKYVRNTTTPAVGVTPITYNGVDYYRSGIFAAPNELLEYLLVVTTTAAGLTSAVAGDTLPEFTSYELTTTQLNLIAVTDGTGTVPDPTFTLDATDTTNGGLLLDDNGARTAGTQGTGIVGATQTVNILYQVRVDP